MRKRRNWYGRPQINTRIPEEQMRLFREVAARRGVSVATIAREAFQACYDAVKQSQALQQVSEPLPALPQTKRMEADTGRSESRQTLQEIDRKRRSTDSTPFT